MPSSVYSGSAILMCFYVECQTCSGAKFYVELFVEKQVLLWCCKAHESVRVLLPRSRAVFSSVKSAVHEAGVAGRFAPAETAGGTCPIRKRNGYNLAANQSTISGFSMVAFEKLKNGPKVYFHDFRGRERSENWSYIFGA